MRKSHRETTVERERLPEKWNRPGPETLKVNIDGSFCCVCHDSGGRLVDGFAKSMKAFSVKQVEAIALDKGSIFLSLF